MFGGNFVESGFETALEVARKRCARDDGRIDPAREFITKVIDDVLHGDRCGLEVRREEAQDGAIDECADEFGFVDADADGLALTDACEVAFEQMSEGVDFEAAANGGEGSERSAAEQGSSDHFDRGARGILRAGMTCSGREDFARIGGDAEAVSRGDVVCERSA